MTRFASLLTVAFVVLKLLGYIDWAWLWVLMPLLVSVGGQVLFLAGLFTFAFFTDTSMRRNHS